MTCIALYFILGRGQASSPDPSPLDNNPVTVAEKCYEDNSHYVALIRIKCDLAQRADEYNNM